MEADPWHVKLKRWYHVQVWLIKCRLRFIWDLQYEHNIIKGIRSIDLSEIGWDTKNNYEFGLFVGISMLVCFFLAVVIFIAIIAALLSLASRGSGSF